VTSNRRKVLVSGASGFTGMKLCQALAKQDLDILAVKRSSNGLVKKNVSNLREIDLDNTIEILEVLESNDVLAVIHLATRYNSDEQFNQSNDIWNVNFALGKKLLAIAIRSKAHFLHIESYLQFEDMKPSEYIRSKTAFSNLINQERNRERVAISSLVFFDNYGERDKRKKILDLLIDAKKSSTEVKLKNPNSVLILTSINDVISAILKVIREEKCGRFRVNASDKYVLRDLAEFINSFPNGKSPVAIETLTYRAENFPLLDTFCQTEYVLDYIKWRLSKESIDGS